MSWEVTFVWTLFGFHAGFVEVTRLNSSMLVSFYPQLNVNCNYLLLHICFTDVVKLCSTLRQKYETTGIKHVPITALHHLAPFLKNDNESALNNTMPVS